MSIDGGLRALFREHLRAGFDWTSVETGGTGRGVPDSNYCTDGAEGWVEFKVTTGWVCTLRPEQCAWLVRRALHGGRVLVATRRLDPGGPRRGEPADDLYLHDGRFARELRSGGLTAVPALVSCGGGPSVWDWAAVRAALGARVGASGLAGDPLGGSQGS